jgi:hypothetical protein
VDGRALLVTSWRIGDIVQSLNPEPDFAGTEFVIRRSDSSTNGASGWTI